jgi:hypothetical protein
MLAHAGELTRAGLISRFAAYRFPTHTHLVHRERFHRTKESHVATKLKIIKDVADAEIVAPPKVPLIDFDPAPTRKRRAGWTAEKQRKFIEHLALGSGVGESCGLVGMASRSAYRLRNKAGADSFARAWDAALVLATTRGTAIAWDRALNGRVERFYKDGELVMERRIPSDYLLTWLLSRLDPLTFGSPAAKAHALAAGDPREKARNQLPKLVDSFEDVPEEECPTESIDFLDPRLGETGTGWRIEDDERD